MHVFRGYSAGAVDYVFKPIEPLILKSKVDVFVDLHRKTEEIRRQATEERRLLMENLKVRSEKLKTEQMLRRREEHQSIILQSLPIALFTASLQEDHRRLHFTKDGITSLTGFQPEAFLERDDFWSSRVHPEDRDRVLAQLRDLPDQGTVSLEYRWRCADGTDRHFLDHTVVVRDDDDNPREFFGMWFDITERKQLEQNLLHASKLEAVGRLTGGIAHDFNNMLSVVIGNLDLMQKSLKGNERAQKRVKMALDGAQRCADLTHRLLAFSRRQPLQASTIDVERRHARPAGTDAPDSGREHPRRACQPRGHLADPGRSRPARSRPGQPGRQCPGRDAQRRRAQDRAREPDAWRTSPIRANTW